MNKAFFTLLAVLFFSCCNNTSNEKNTAGSANIPEQEKQLRDLAAQYPDSLLLKENLIQYFRENGNYGQAIAETGYALQKDSLNGRLWYMKATLLSENEDTTQAIKAWEKVVAINPQPENILSLGSLYALTKNPLALSLADALLQAPKANAQVQALFIKGLYYSTAGDKTQAIDLFNKCLSLDYSFLFAYREKAICLYDLGKYVDALKVLETSLFVKKTNEEAYYWMGRCFEKIGKKEEAIQNYQLALQFDPKYIEAKDALGKLGVVQ
jgi:tetratricopeptide (TPR) repeat protein